MNTTCQACKQPMAFEPGDRLLFCENDDCDQFGIYPEIIACINCHVLAASNPAQRCDDCQRVAMQQQRSVYFPKDRQTDAISQNANRRHSHHRI